MSIRERISFFNGAATTHKNTAVSLLKQQSTVSFLPYHSWGYHRVSIIYPLCHVTKIIVSAARILHGGLLLLGAVFDDPTASIPQVISGMINEFVTMLLNVTNVIVSTVLLITRTLATLYNLEYLSDTICTDVAEQQVELCELEKVLMMELDEDMSYALIECDIAENTMSLLA